jgi:transposase
MSRFVEGEDRRQATLLPSCPDDYVGEDNPARVIDVFVDELHLGDLGFVVTPAATGRPPAEGGPVRQAMLTALRSYRPTRFRMTSQLVNRAAEVR